MQGSDPHMEGSGVLRDARTVWSVWVHPNLIRQMLREFPARPVQKPPQTPDQFGFGSTSSIGSGPFVRVASDPKRVITKRVWLCLCRLRAKSHVRCLVCEAPTREPPQNDMLSASPPTPDAATTWDPNPRVRGPDLLTNPYGFGSGPVGL